MSELYSPYLGLYNSREIEKVKKFLQTELDRSLLHLGKKAKPRAYYLAYLFKNQRIEKLYGRLGGINEQTVASQNHLFCDIRVGSYRYDNVTNGGLGEEPDEDLLELTIMPVELNEDSYRYSIWKLTDACYRIAAEEYFDKKARELHYVDQNREIVSMAHRTPARRWKPAVSPPVDTDYWKFLIKKAGLFVKRYPSIKNSWFEFVVRHTQSVYVSSEGHEIFQQQAIFELRGYFWLLSRTGETISYEINLIEGDPAFLPGERDFLRLVKNKIELLFEIERAPRLNSFSGPVLLSADAAGLFFHEVIGHRLEGSRLLSPDEGATFMDLRNKRIAPDFIDIVDDPTISTLRGRPMIGHYRFDDEGSEAARVILVDRGVLKNFLTTASPIPGQKELNGHARNQRHERPISRMGNLLILNREPRSEEEMKDAFLEEIRRQKKPFGIYVKETLGGETGTTSYDFQAFKGEIMHAVKVYPDGKEEIVRGVDFVGTPLTALESVLCMGADPHLDNSYCGAESGVVPVSTVSPSALMRNLELQSKDRERLAPYLLPLPYERNHSN